VKLEGHTRDGFVTSIMLTKKEHEFERPLKSVAVQVTWVEPSENMRLAEERSGEHETVLMPDCASVALSDPL
jgi:hypothetical protein